MTKTISGRTITLDENNLVIAEDSFAVKMNLWKSSDNKIARYYVTRAGKKIGWIAFDLSDCGGAGGTTEKSWLWNYIEAMKA